MVLTSSFKKKKSVMIWVVQSVVGRLGNIVKTHSKNLSPGPRLFLLTEACVDRIANGKHSYLFGL